VELGEHVEDEPDSGARLRLGVLFGAVVSATTAAFLGRLVARVKAVPVEQETRSGDERGRLIEEVGHDLRVPLTSIRSNIDMLRTDEDRLSEEDRAQVLHDVSSELEHLMELTDELIGLAKGSPSEPAQAVDMHALVSRSADRFSRRSGRAVRICGETWVVQGRPRALERAVNNLLENAAKFSPSSTPIEVTARQGRLTVRDHGKGIPEGEGSRIFERFYRSQTTSAQPGSGLGLAIVDRIVRLHGGRTMVGNCAAAGAIVGFEIPVSTMDEARARGNRHFDV
jgi:two-component system, OmpR family, sensor histidine kinase MprB